MRRVEISDPKGAGGILVDLADDVELHSGLGTTSKYTLALALSEVQAVSAMWAQDWPPEQWKWKRPVQRGVNRMGDPRRDPVVLVLTPRWPGPPRHAPSALDACGSSLAGSDHLRELTSDRGGVLRVL
jgi:hypothetical protein